jgi:serine/threonine protein phosphatase PrpC
MRESPDLPAVEYAERSDPGRDPEKQVNEDACGYQRTRFGHLSVVCDGMGGHAAGQEAAQLALATVFEVFDRTPDGTAPAQVLRSAIEEASQRVHSMRSSEIAMGRPGSTLVAVLLHASGTEVAHVGDSRAYLVHERQIFRLTNDHSIVQELVDRGLISPQQAVHHPEANRITRALGMSKDVEAELRPQPVHHVPGDAFVLCTDGLCDLVEDREILEVVGGEPAAQAVGKLVDLANARGGHDNITVAILRARETAIAHSSSIAPTLAQTATTESKATASTPTVIETPPRRSLEPTPSAPLTTRSTRRLGNPAVLVGLALAAVAVILLVGVLLDEFAERRGKRNAKGSTVLDLSSPDGRIGASGAGAASPSPVPLVPESIAVPTMSAPIEPIAPLDPSTPAPNKRKH